MHKARHAVNPRTEGFALAVLLGLGVALAVFQDVADDQNEPDGQASDCPPPAAQSSRNGYQRSPMIVFVTATVGRTHGQ